MLVPVSSTRCGFSIRLPHLLATVPTSEVFIRSSAVVLAGSHRYGLRVFDSGVVCNFGTQVLHAIPQAVDGLALDVLSTPIDVVRDWKVTILISDHLL